MSHSQRRLAVGQLARVEGEGGIDVRIVGGEVHEVRLDIFEPPRFFEGFLRGRAYTEPPDITARICGICPVAYQMSAVQAIESLCNVSLPAPLRALRSALYCGEWIESHTLHVHLLHAPDFLGYESAIAMAADHRPEVERGLALKQLGNDLVEVIGGRAVHPVNVRLGGFYKAPSKAGMRALGERLRIALDDAEDIVRWVASLPMPDHELPDEFALVALRHPVEYPMLGDRVVSTGGPVPALDIGPDEYEAHFAEHQAPHSTALHGQMLAGGDYVVGPIARFALNHDHLSPRARAVAAEVGAQPGDRNPFRTIVTRSIEVVHACETALDVCAGYEQPEAAAVEVAPRAGVGCGWSEAPRGLLWHRYELDPEGTILSARIVPPTSQHQPAIEHDLHHLVEEHLHLDDAELERLCGQAVRNFDPCISCATHALDIRIDRRCDQRGGEGE
ncbi:MAG: Ni/Fe hydrogenase subunit alpha [Ilumatobacteraceae bacterium]